MSNRKSTSRGAAAQTIVEYALMLVAFLGIFIVGAAAVSNSEHGYLTSLGPLLAPQPTEFATLPPAAPTPGVPPGSTATPTLVATPTPTPLPTAGNPVTLTWSCQTSGGQTWSTNQTVTGDIPVSGGSSSFSINCSLTVTGANGNPGGTVAWSVNPATVGSFTPPTCTLTNSGAHAAVCSVNYQTALAGAQTLTAFYSGDHQYTNGGVSIPVLVQRHTSVAVSCVPTDPVVGQAPPVTCTATITDISAGTAIAPTGAPAWSAAPSNAGTFGSNACNVSGTSESCSTTYTPTAAGSQTMTATYSGDTAHLASSPGSATLSVGPAATSISGEGGGITYGTTSVALVAFVSPNVPSQATVNEGSVTFSIGSPTIGAPVSCSLSSPQGCSVTFNGSQAAVSTTYSLPSNLAPGSYPITMTYSGGPEFQSSTSTAVYYLAVGNVDTTIKAGAVSVAYNVGSVQLSGTANVAYPGTGVVTQGTVVFSVTSASGTLICTTSPSAVSPSDGTVSATCSIPAQTPVGTYTVTPSYTGQGNFNSCTSGACVLTGTLSITPRSTSTQVVCNPSAFNAGASTTCTVTVTDNDTGTAVSPTGSVVLTDSAGGTTPTTPGCNLTAGGGSSSCQVSFAATEGGSQTISAGYSGDSVHDASTSTSPQTLMVYRTTAVSVVCSPSPIDAGVSTTCTANATDTSPGTVHTPTGVITWAVSPDIGGAFSSSSTCTLDATGGCSVSFTPSKAGSATLTATFAGSGMFVNSSGSAVLTVNLRTTSTTVACTSGQDSVGTADPCTVTVTDTDAGTKTTPAGSVTWSDTAAASLSPATCTLTPGTTNGVATCGINDTPAAPGMHTLTAQYGGDTSVHSISSGSTIFKAVLGTTTAINCTPAPDAIDAPATCTATVKGGWTSVPTGTVTWTTDTSASGSPFSSLTCALDASGICSVAYTPSAFGSGNVNTLTASYGGDTYYLPSSGSSRLTVSTRQTTVSITCTPSPVPAGSSTTCTAAVVDTSAGTPPVVTGTITWSAPAAGTLSATTCTLSAGGCSVVYTAPSTAQVVAFSVGYSGDVNHSPASATANLSIVRTTGTTISCTPSPATAGAAVTCTVTITDNGSSHVTPSGTVSFGVVPASGGSFASGATCSLSGGGGNGATSACSIGYTPALAGAQTLSAAYAGDANHAGSSGTTSLTVNAGPAARLVMGQQPSNGTSMLAMNPAVTVSIQDAYGNPVTSSTASVVMAIQTNPSGGTLSGTTSVSAVNGVATFGNLLIDKVGTGYTLAASSSGLTGVTSSAFNITAGPAARLAFTTQPSSVVAGTAISPAVAVTVQDAGGNAVTTSGANVTLSIGANPGTGTLSGSLGTNAVNGTASFSNLSINRTGSAYTLVASSAGLTSSTSSAFNITSGPASQLVVTAPSTATAGLAFSVTVTAQDAFGNTATGYTGTIGFSTTDGRGMLPASYTFVAADSGAHTFTNQVALKTAGAQTISATDTVRSSTFGTSGAISVNAGTATSLLVGGYPTSTTAGSGPSSFTVTAKDAFGNVATGYSGTVQFTSSDAQASFTSNNVMLTSGTGTFSATLRTAGTQSITATDQANGAINGTQAGLIVAPMATSRLVVAASGGSTTAGVRLSVTVTAQDPYGNTTPSYLGTVHFSSSDASASLPANYTFVAGDAGVHTFNGGVNLETAGSQTLTATDTSVSTISGTSSAISVSAAAGTRLAFTQQPTNTVSNVAISPTVSVTVQDQFGNVATGSAASIVLSIGTNPGGGKLSGTTTVSAVNGAASFSGISIDKAGSGYTLAANSTGLTATISSAFNVTPGVATRLAFTTQPSSAIAGSSISPSVQVAVQDVAGNTVTGSTAGIAVAVGTNPAGGTLSGTLSVSAVNGVATFGDLSIDKAGTGYTLSVSSSGLSSAASSGFTISAGTAAKLAFIVQPSTASRGAIITPAIQVAIQDALGNTVTGSTATVSMAVTGNAAPLSGTTSVAASGGVASFGNLSISTRGTYTLTATSGSLSATSSSFKIN